MCNLGRELVLLIVVIYSSAIKDTPWLIPCEKVYGSAFVCLRDVAKNYDPGVLLGVVVGAGKFLLCSAITDL
jgi:hypothetical protein